MHKRRPPKRAHHFLASALRKVTLAVRTRHRACEPPIRLHNLALEGPAEALVERQSGIQHLTILVKRRTRWLLSTGYEHFLCFGHIHVTRTLSHLAHSHRYFDFLHVCVLPYLTC